MNKELFIKLVKLANHNPNENEANLAARKVCKMIEASKFEFTNETKQPLTSNQVRENVYKTQAYSNPKPSYNRAQYWDDMFKNIDFNNPFRTGAWDTNSQSYYREETRKKQNNKRKLKCKTCGIEINTIFQGLESLFECNTCQWSAYERNRK